MKMKKHRSKKPYNIHPTICTHTYTKHIQTYIHSYKTTYINTNTYILMHTYKTRTCLGTKIVIMLR